MALDRQLIEGKALPPSGFKETALEWIVGTIFYNSSAAVAPALFFKLSNPNKEYQSIDGTTALEKKYLIREIVMTHNLQFGTVGGVAVTAALAAAAQYAFEHYSYLTIEKSEKKYAPIPLHVLLPYDTIPSGTGYAIGKKAVSRYRLSLPIVWGGGQNLEWGFVPLSSTVMPATGANTPILPDSGLTGSQGGAVTLFLGCQVLRPTN